MNQKTMTSFALVISLAVAPQAFAQGMQRPTASDHAPANPAIKSPDAITWGKLSKGRNSFTQGEAGKRLGKAGYTHITQLQLDKDGLWQGRAKFNGRSVRVALDYKGNVAHR